MKAKLVAIFFTFIISHSSYALIGSRAANTNEFSRQCINRLNGFRDSYDNRTNVMVAIGPRVALITTHTAIHKQKHYLTRYFQKNNYTRNLQVEADMKKEHEATLKKDFTQWTNDEVDTFYKHILLGVYLGYWDFGVYILPASEPDFKPPYANISPKPLKKNETILLFYTNLHFDEARANQPVKSLYARFRVAGFTVDGTDTYIDGYSMGYPDNGNALQNISNLRSRTEPGDSGSMYLRVLADNTVELVGLHARGQHAALAATSEYRYSAGVNLTNPEVLRWIQEVVGDNKVCGLTMECPKNQLSFIP